MRTKDRVRVGSNVHLELFGPDGQLKEERWAHNIIPTVGLNYIADRMTLSHGSTIMGYMAVGTSSTSPSAGDTQLGAEVAASRTALSSMTDFGAIVTHVATFGAGVGTGGLQEAGIFNDATAGLGAMLARLTFAIVNKGALDTLQVTWTVTFGDDGI